MSLDSEAVIALSIKHIKSNKTCHLPSRITQTFINHSNSFLDLSPKAKEIKAKINKWDLLKSFCIAKEPINKMKRQPTE